MKCAKCDGTIKQIAYQGLMIGQCSVCMGLFLEKDVIEKEHLLDFTALAASFVLSATSIALESMGVLTILLTEHGLFTI